MICFEVSVHYHYELHYCETWHHHPKIGLSSSGHGTSTGQKHSPNSQILLITSSHKLLSGQPYLQRTSEIILVDLMLLALPFWGKTLEQAAQGSEGGTVPGGIFKKWREMFKRSGTKLFLFMLSLPWPSPTKSPSPLCLKVKKPVNREKGLSWIFSWGVTDK